MWGDESVVYTKLLNAVIIIGGRAGTMVEVTHILKQNENKRFAVKPIIPITGTGGTADMLAYFPGNQSVMSKSLPHHIIQDGKGALSHLIDQGIITDDLFD
jgi:predicted Rossmann-fold nucleotide-binding protein